MLLLVVHGLRLRLVGHRLLLVVLLLRLLLHVLVHCLGLLLLLRLHLLVVLGRWGLGRRLWRVVRLLHREVKAAYDLQVE